MASAAAASVAAGSTAGMAAMGPNSAGLMAAGLGMAAGAGAFAAAATGSATSLGSTVCDSFLTGSDASAATRAASTGWAGRCSSPGFRSLSARSLFGSISFTAFLECVHEHNHVLMAVQCGESWVRSGTPPALAIEDGPARYCKPHAVSVCVALQHERRIGAAEAEGNWTARHRPCAHAPCAARDRPAFDVRIVQVSASAARRYRGSPALRRSLRSRPQRREVAGRGLGRGHRDLRRMIAEQALDSAEFDRVGHGRGAVALM